VIFRRLEINTSFKIRSWERYCFRIDYVHDQHKAILENQLPENLKLAIAKKIENNLFLKVPFLTGMSSISEIRTIFAAELLLRSKTLHFSQGSIIADSHESAQGLMVITSGFVNVELPIESDEADEENKSDTGRTVLYVFGRGDSFGGSAVIGDLRWTGTFGVNMDVVARSHCSVQLIKTEDILVIPSFPRLWR